MRPLSSQCSQDLIQQILHLREQRTQRATVVQQISDIAEQIAQQIARTWYSRDVQHNLVQVNRQAQNIQIQGAKYEVQDLAVRVNAGNRKSNRLRYGIGGSIAVRQSSSQKAFRYQLMVLNVEMVNGYNATEYVSCCPVIALHK